MLLTIAADISTSDLGYLLHKNPARIHDFDLPFGKAHVFYPEQSVERSQAALLLDVDPVGLVRGRSQAVNESLRQYVNDRPYAASSFLSVALSNVFGTAMNGRSKERQALADQVLDFEAVVTAVPCRAEPDYLDRLFHPLGYDLQSTGYLLDENFPEWGIGPHRTIRLKNRCRLQDLLTHLYVLVPVLDAEKHYWVGEDEVEKLLRKGEGWLANHPERDSITARYLRHDRKLTSSALSRLSEEDTAESDASPPEEEIAVEEPLKLWEQRIGTVLSVLKSITAKSVLDVGCGEGKLLRPLLQDRAFERIVGMDVSWRVLEKASKGLHLDQMAPAARSRIQLIHGSLLYRDARLNGFDAAAVIEVIEHLDPARLAAFEQVLFKHARPGAVIITTPNAEYNDCFESLPAGRLRHRDHRFEWTRSEFQTWANGIGERFDYHVRFLPVGVEDPMVGPPTQMGVFER